LKAPPNAVKLFERGLHSLQQGKFPDAIKDFESANKIYPDYAESWLNLGRARAAAGAIGLARDAFLRAAQLDPQLAEAPEELGLLAAGQNDLASAARYLDESIRLDPGSSYRACYSDAVVNLMLKHYDVAERSARAALRFGDAGAQARVNYVLGIALLARGENSEAKQHLQRYLELNPKAPERDQIEKELSRVEQLESAK
jgi:tetratricopeptide (TPR) repeat protein